ncbi:hypothetical protein ODJ79_09070 [Actinoplanes sp. KI2]|uniref:hypothetical protein n=1 Tax=Actinoplanes sp. KI2 TaxID=2983315 RepID=UPI0021D5E468|nr:hypothetical protein [Actinoplanes sp. KI2]MCU7723863.1 hypothetical protein [Actinoplanes sp. KI2]
MRVGKLAKLALAGTLAVATMAVAAAPAAAAPARPPARAAGTLTSTVNGTFADSLGGVGQVTGTFTPTRFAVQNGKEVAVGTLHSVLTDSAGSQVGTADTPVTLPLQLPSGTSTNAAAPLAACNILHLVLGPLDLNLLGLAVHLNTVVLDITAIPGAGNLLGNLLCAVAGLLDGPLTGPLLGSLTILLNAILALLNL